MAEYPMWGGWWDLFPPFLVFGALAVLAVMYSWASEEIAGKARKERELRHGGPSDV